MRCMLLVTCQVFLKSTTEATIHQVAVVVSQLACASVTTDKTAVRAANEFSTLLMERGAVPLLADMLCSTSPAVKAAGESGGRWKGWLISCTKAILLEDLIGSVSWCGFRAQVSQCCCQVIGTGTRWVLQETAPESPVETSIGTPSYDLHCPTKLHHRRQYDI